VPCADEEWSLLHAETAEGALFRRIAEQGHYAGRTEPSDTRQGLYAAAPSGALLASCNSNDPEEVAGVLRQALEAWEGMPDEERWLGPEAAKQVARSPRAEDQYPENGLVLLVTVRDLPRKLPPDDWRKDASNREYVWFTKEEAAQLAAGGSEAFARRLARFAFVDIARGQSDPYADEQVEKAELKLEGDAGSLRIVGETRTSAEGRWPVQGERDQAESTPQKRGVTVRITGSAAWDAKAGRFTAFQATAEGLRWGGTQFNERQDDLEEAPIRFTLALAGPEERTAPTAFWEYGW
jgi:hypothetical protein